MLQRLSSLALAFVVVLLAAPASVADKDKDTAKKGKTHSGVVTKAEKQRRTPVGRCPPLEA
jgi:hypothetical protein